MKISIIIPVFNKVRYIDRCFVSVIAQEFSDFEAIIVDDGSTDGSALICDQFAVRDKRFHVFHISNQGVSHARNYGMKQASGDYITFIDADDTISEQYLQNLINAKEKSKADLVIGGIQKVTDCNCYDYSVSKNSELPYKGLYSIEELLPEFVDVQKRTGIYGYCVAKLFSRKLAEKCSFDESVKLAEDFDFYLQIYKVIQTIYFLPKADYYYLQDAENSTALVNDWDVDYFSQLLINIRYRNFLAEKHTYMGKNKEILDETICNYFYFSLHYCNISDFEKLFEELEEVRKNNAIVLKGQSVRQLILFRLFSFHMKRVTKIVLIIERKVRNLLRGN